MKSGLTGFLLLASLFTFSQTHRFIYEVKSKKDSTNTKQTSEMYHLDIGTENVFYYARDYFLLDSIMTNQLPMTLMGDVPNLSDVNVHKKNAKKYTTYEITEYDLYKLETSKPQLWELSDEKKKIGPYQVQKATTKWGGRNWTAWFSPEIPFSEGPYKFAGLPGLILEIFDEKDNYVFKIVKSENYPKTYETSQLFSFMMQNAVPVTEEKYRKMKLSHYQDPLSFLKLKMPDFQFAEDNWAMLKDGTKVTGKNQKEVIVQQQESLKKYNNPIEIDQAIHYPQKKK